MMKMFVTFLKEKAISLILQYEILEKLVTYVATKQRRCLAGIDLVSFKPQIFNLVTLKRSEN